MAGEQNIELLNVTPDRWHLVFWRFWVPPWATLGAHCYGNDFFWKINGAGPPFSVSGGAQRELYAPLGWGGFYAELLIRPVSMTNFHLRVTGIL